MYDEINLDRLIRIETRLARIQENMGLPTRMRSEEVKQSEFAEDISVAARLSRIETRIYRMLEAMNLNPRTGLPK
jgi:hypothetical protein